MLLARRNAKITNEMQKANAKIHPIAEEISENVSNMCSIKSIITISVTVQPIAKLAMVAENI